MLRRCLIANNVAPALSAIIRAVYAAFIRGPEFAGFRSRAEQRRDCAGWLRPAVAHAFPAVASDASIHTAIRAAGDIGGAGAGRFGIGTWPMMGSTDQAFSALIEDMHQRGLLADTLVCFVTEFGRTP